MFRRHSTTKDRPEFAPTRFVAPRRLLNNLIGDTVLKGRSFKPRRKCSKTTPALAAEVTSGLHKGISEKRKAINSPGGSSACTALNFSHGPRFQRNNTDHQCERREMSHGVTDSSPAEPALSCRRPSPGCYSRIITKLRLGSRESSYDDQQQ